MVDSRTSRREGSVWYKTGKVKEKKFYCSDIFLLPGSQCSRLQVSKLRLAGLELPLFSPGRARFANVKVNLVSCLIPQGAAGLPPEGCSHQGEFPPAAFYPSASTSGPPGWCSAGLSPAPEMWFSSYLAFSTLPWGSQPSPREWRRRCTLLLEESSPSPSSPPEGREGCCSEMFTLEMHKHCTIEHIFALMH